jgi:magnesium transporter
MAGPAESIASIMIKDVVSIPSSATLLTACEFFALHRFLSCPVVDEQNRLLGVADIDLFTDEVFSLAEKRSADDLFQLIGVHVALGRRASPWVSFKDRFPWLLCNIAGGTLCALIASLYDALLNQAIALALFIPVVLALSESVSIQSMTITLQSLHAGRLDWKRARSSLGREFLASALIGLACGAALLLISLAWRGDWIVSLAIGLSIWISMITSCLVGVALPMVMRALRQDPRIASGPIVLASADLLTLLFYLNLAGLLLRP